MIRVLVDGYIYTMQSHGGVGRCFTEFLTRIGQQESKIEVILDCPGHAKGVLPDGPGVRHFNNWDLRPRGLLSPLSTRLNRARLRAMRPQVFHSTYYTSPYWPGMKTVVTVHDFIDEKSFETMSGNRAGFAAWKRRVIEEADAVIAVSQATKEDILRYTKVSAEKVSVVHHGVGEAFLNGAVTEEEVNWFREENGIACPYWLFVGRRLRYKNFAVLLRAWKRVVCDCGVDSYLVAIGPHEGLESWQIDFLIQNCLEQRLVLLSGVDDQTCRAAYGGASAFIFPSLFEGFGIPLQEAMACRTPIIASDIPVFHEVASEAALYFDPHDENALAELMVRILDPEVRQVLTEKGERRVGYFSWEESASQIADIYRSLVQ